MRQGRRGVSRPHRTRVVDVHDDGVAYPVGGNEHRQLVNARASAIPRFAAIGRALIGSCGRVASVAAWVDLVRIGDGFRTRSRLMARRLRALGRSARVAGARRVIAESNLCHRHRHARRGECVPGPVDDQADAQHHSQEDGPRRHGGYSNPMKSSLHVWIIKHRPIRARPCAARATRSAGTSAAAAPRSASPASPHGTARRRPRRRAPRSPRTRRCESIPRPTPC